MVLVISRRELLLGLVLPLAVVALLVALGFSGRQPIACIAFLAAVPMFAAMFSRPLLTGIVALVSVLSAMVMSASAFGLRFSEAIPIIVGVIIGASAAVLASQSKTQSRPPARAQAREATAAGGAPATSPGTDIVTGLPNRASVLSTLTGPNTSTARVIMVIGCDGMAALNEERGRDLGDVFLFAVAGRTRWALPEDDIVARWDGDEILAVITADPAGVGPTLQLITDKVNHNPIRTDAGLIPLTISAGAAAWPVGADFADAVDRARRAMHAAKGQGPGRLVMESAREAESPDVA